MLIIIVPIYNYNLGLFMIICLNLICESKLNLYKRQLIKNQINSHDLKTVSRNDQMIFYTNMVIA